MKRRRQIPDGVRADQNAASDPQVSAFASANAGSGKTHVLTQRVIKLLLDGEDPARILCITFTKAAAATMARRVFATLSDWIALDDAALDREIADIGLRASPALRLRARRLFALALETPGGLKVQTIHAFCTRLLHLFPFEAEVGVGFEVLDDTTQSQILETLSLEVLREGAARPDTPLGRALAQAIAAAGDQTFRDLVHEAVLRRETIAAWIEGAGSIDAAIARLSQALQIDPQEAGSDIENRILDEAGFAASEWMALAALLSAGTDSDRKQAEKLKAAAQLGARARLLKYVSVFCTEKMQRRSAIVTKKIREAHPHLAERLEREQERICALLDRHRAVQCRDRTQALLTVAHEVIQRYGREKARRGVLDYDDLIDRTLALFRRSSAAWVLYKLDRGIDHLLLDEAQDTNPKQWQIVATLVSEFTAGEGARGKKRTLFAVGDDKQSIFSFQGAAPEKFGEMKKTFGSAFAAAQLEWRDVSLRTSFRSSEIVLQAVDAVFRRPVAYAGLSSDSAWTVHQHLPDALPGSVELWPLIEADAKQETEGWDAPFDTASESSPQVRLARRIADHVRIWCSRGTKAGDVLVLVRQRGPLFEAIIRALKDRNLPVAGADRLVLTEHIAVMDLIALADALLLPADDLALAVVLRSPLFGLSEEELFTLAWNRGKQSLRAALFGKANDFAEAADRLKQLTDAALRQSPFAFYAQLLGPGGARKRFVARLGPEANDALDEFLNLALDYERRETPSLQGFVAWLRAACAEVKRDMEMARDEVRVMTVHGAKGLEAPIVILAETTNRPEGRHPLRLLSLPDAAGGGLVWAGAKDNDPPLLTQARENTMQALGAEHRRLLYVAMTRAERRLVVCGTAGTPKQDGTPSIPEDCWYRLIEDALAGDPESACIEIAAEDGGTPVRSYRSSPQLVLPAEDKAAPPPVAPPDWLHRPMPAETPRAAAIAPSATDDTDARGAGGGIEREKAIRRGRILHRLIQSLPDLPPATRAQAARAYLQRNADGLAEQEAQDIATQMFRILDDPQFAPLFLPGSRAEVPIVGVLPREGLSPLTVAGQVDRLAVDDDSVLIADYKTNRPAPASVADVPRAYRRQLALYRALLRRLYPDRAVRAALVFTEIPRLIEIPADFLDAELATLTRT